MPKKLTGVRAIRPIRAIRSLGSIKPKAVKPASKRPRTSEREDAPMPRNPSLEQALCGAIHERKLVELQYENDVSHRLVAPHAVYRSTADKINVTGMQLENPGDPLDRDEPRNFEIGKIRSVRISDQVFRPDPRFDRSDCKYQRGIVCFV